MNRDPSILLMLMFIFGSYVYVLIKGEPIIIDENTGQGLVLTILLFAFIIRMIVFWFQTFFHSLKIENKNIKGIWIIAHLLGGPITSFVYYFSQRKVNEKAIGKNETSSTI